MLYSSLRLRCIRENTAIPINLQSSLNMLVKPVPLSERRRLGAPYTNDLLIELGYGLAVISVGAM